MSFSSVAPTAVMCAEALWWQCHRRLLADALTVHGVAVLHILPSGKAQPHEITPFARVLGARVSYRGLRLNSSSRRISNCAVPGPSRTINCLNDRPSAERSRALALTCANCGNDRNFQVKTVQMHVVHLEDDRVEVSDEGRPAVLEVLCDECENPHQLRGIRRRACAAK